MKKKILVLGGAGMLGHKVVQALAETCNVFSTVRSLQCLNTSLIKPAGVTYFDKVDIEDFASVESIMLSIKPDVTVNCIGIVKQLAEAENHIASIWTNSLFPHKIAKLGMECGSRIISLSTDCVFSGARGNYREIDKADPVDLYGQTKLLGELDYPHCLTVRTSMIGRQLSGSHGLVEWFLNQQGKTIKGYKQAIFSGFTTLELAKIIQGLIIQEPSLSGLWHISADAISKFDLLSLIKNIYELDIEISPDDSFSCDRSLNSDRFRAATNFIPSQWPDMIQSMKEDKNQIPHQQVSRC